MTVADIPEIGRSILLEDVSWGLYQKILREQDGSHLQFTYDCGRLEIMAPSPFHESIKSIAGRILETYATEAGIEIRPLGSTTFTRQDLEKGLEPDECYYIANASKVIGKRRLNLKVDPPPDLAIEVDYTSRSIEREPVYASLGVGELWRHDGNKFTYLKLSRQRKYVGIEKSLAFPDFPAADFNRFVEMGQSESHLETMRAVQRFARRRTK